MSAAALPHQRLRTATVASHESVDAAFGCFDLADPGSYAAFLTAHARALRAVETVLTGDPELPSFQARAPLLLDDLARLGHTAPKALPFDRPATLAGRFGALYVMEGSRLGGALLARRVGKELPTAYLSATHPPGAWRVLLAEFDRLAIAGGADWEAEALSSARQTFAIYGRSAG